MICPKLRHRNNMDMFCSAPVAHRGIHDNITVPENSLPAFNAAAEAGCGIELDVQFTKDRQLVVFHDDNLSVFLTPMKKFRFSPRCLKQSAAEFRFSLR